MNESSITYHVSCELDNCIPLNTTCEYSTVSDLSTTNDQLENPYQIAKNILSQASYKLYPTETFENGKSIPTKYALPFINDYISFITDQNMSVIEAVDYLLSHAVGESGMNPPAYLIHNLLDDKGYITTVEKCLSEAMKRDKRKASRIPHSITESMITLNKTRVVLPNFNSPLGGILGPKLFFNYKFSEYDQEEREWNYYNISKLVLNDLLTKGMNASMERSIFVNELKEDLSMSKFYKYPPHTYEELYYVLKDLELYSSCFDFYLEGDLTFDIGQSININERGKNDSTIEEFNGNWLITKIRHSFRNKDYRMHVICSRRFYQQHVPNAET